MNPTTINAVRPAAALTMSRPAARPAGEPQGASKARPAADSLCLSGARPATRLGLPADKPTGQPGSHRGLFAKQGGAKEAAGNDPEVKDGIFAKQGGEKSQPGTEQQGYLMSRRAADQ